MNSRSTLVCHHIKLSRGTRLVDQDIIALVSGIRRSKHNLNLCRRVINSRTLAIATSSGVLDQLRRRDRANDRRSLNSVGFLYSNSCSFTHCMESTSILPFKKYNQTLAAFRPQFCPLAASSLIKIID